ALPLLQQEIGAGAETAGQPSGEGVVFEIGARSERDRAAPIGGPSPGTIRRLHRVPVFQIDRRGARKALAGRIRLRGLERGEAAIERGAELSGERPRLRRTVQPDLEMLSSFGVTHQPKIGPGT